MEIQLRNDRNHTLNYLKTLASFCVVMLHCGFPSVIGKLIYGPSRFAVPLFFMISGYFVYSENKDKVIKRLPSKIKHIGRLLIGTEITYFLWHVIQCGIESGSLGIIEWLKETFTVGKIVQLFVFQTTPVGDVSWFLVALLICYVVTYLIAKKDLWEITTKFIPVLLTINVVVGEILPFAGISVQWYWNSNFWILGFPFYAMGYWIRINERHLCEKVTGKSTCVVVAVSLIVILVERIMTSASQLFIGNIFCVLALFLFCLKYPRIFGANSIIETVGEKYSFYVYILHAIIRDIFGVIFGMVGLGNNTMVLWIRPVVVFAVCIVLAYGICKASNSMLETSVRK